MRASWQAKKEKGILFLILGLILVVCFGIWYLRADLADEVYIESDTPEWHLHEYDFEKVYVRARGSIAEYVPEQHLTPEEFENADFIVGKPKNAADYLTSRFRLYVPDGKVYVLTTDSVDFADRIFINGQLYQEIGRPAATREEMIPSTRSVYYTVVPENGVIEIVQQVSNFVHRDGGNPVGFRIGSFNTAGRYYDRRLNMTSIMMGVCLMMALTHLVLFSMQRSYKANLYLCLCSLVWLLQAAAAGQRVLVALFPSLTWNVPFRIEYMSVPLATLFMMLALDDMFKGLVQRPVKIAGGIACCAVALYYLFADTLPMSLAKNTLHNIMNVLQLYMLLRFLWRFLRRERSTEAIIVFSGLCVYFYAMIRDLLYRNDIPTFPRVSSNIVDAAMMVFIIFQMVAAFYGTMREVAAAKEGERAALQEAEALRESALRREALYKGIPRKHLVVRGPLALNTLSRQAYLHENDLLLSPKEFAMLFYLVQHEGEVISKERLFEEVWQRPLAEDENALKSTIYRMRKKLEGSGYRIRSLRNRGYCFEKIA